MKLNVVSCTLVVTLMVKYTSPYVNLTMEDDDLCSLTRNPRKIRLDKGPKSALIVTQRLLNNHPLDWQNNIRCRFQVVAASPREGIIAVIQHLSFRKNATTDECIDYVQFRRRDGSSSQKFCGNFNAAIFMDHNFGNPSESISSGTAYVDERGELEAYIFVAKERLRNEEEADISIVFTAYKPCSQVLKRDTSYRPCNNERKEFCIFSGFFLDSYINCPLPDCEDEEGCSKHSDIVDYYYGNRVLIGAVSSVFIVFALFILCLWICKTYRVFCWSQSFAHPSSTTPPTQPNETPRVIELNEQSSRSTTSQATHSANPVDEDKDLPPSYDSLFPSSKHFHQIQTWLGKDLEPQEWGWMLENEILEPIRTLLPPAPTELLNIIFCNCKNGCGSRCGCRKSGLLCSLACGQCNGQACLNASLYPSNPDEETAYDSEILEGLEMNMTDNEDNDNELNIFERQQEESDEDEEDT